MLCFVFVNVFIEGVLIFVDCLMYVLFLEVVNESKVMFRWFVYNDKIYL